MSVLTKLQNGRPVIRETSVEYKGRRLVVELYPDRLVLRSKYKHTDAVMIGYVDAYEMAARAAAWQAKNMPEAARTNGGA